jgi:hypothetical protein
VSVKDISVNNARARYAAKKSRKANKINAQFVTSVPEITRILLELVPEITKEPPSCGKVHTPSDLVVDHWSSDVESSSPLDFLLLHAMWTPFGRFEL